MAECLEIDLGSRITFDGISGGGILLVAGHTGDGVIQNNDGGCGSVINDIGKSCHAGMYKGGISDDAHHLMFVFMSQGLIEAVHSGKGCAHADI